MKKQVLKTYQINRKTMALIPVANLHYRTLVIETDAEYYVEQTPLQMIEDRCIRTGCTYEGKRDAVMRETGIKHKVPIAIDPLELIYAFPTHSPSQFNCVWLFHKHIHTFKPDRNTKGTIITFQTDRELKVDASYYTIKNQIQRSSYCMFRFSNQLFETLKTIPVLSV